MTYIDSINAAMDKVRQSAADALGTNMASIV